MEAYGLRCNRWTLPLLAAMLIALQACAMAETLSCEVVTPIAESRFAEGAPPGWTMGPGWAFESQAAVAKEKTWARQAQPAPEACLIEMDLDLPGAKAGAAGPVSAELRVGAPEAQGDAGTAICSVQYHEDGYRAYLTLGRQRIGPFTVHSAFPNSVAEREATPPPPAGGPVSVALGIGNGRLRLLVNGSEAGALNAKGPAGRFVTITANTVAVRSVRMLPELPARHVPLSGAGIGADNDCAVTWEASALEGVDLRKSVRLDIGGVSMLVLADARGIASLDVAKEAWTGGKWSMGTGALIGSVPARPYSEAYVLFRVNRDDPAAIAALGCGFRTDDCADVKNIYLEGRTRTNDEGVTVTPVPALGADWHLARLPLNPAAMHWKTHDRRPGSRIPFHVGRPFRMPMMSSKPQHAGKASALRVGAVTFVESGIDLRVEGNGLGNVYCEPAEPSLDAVLSNLTSEPVEITITAELIPYGREPIARKWSLTLPADARHTVSALAAPVTGRGHYKVRLVADAGDLGRSEWRTNVALLATDTRKKENTPFGCWHKLSDDGAAKKQRQYLFDKAGVGITWDKGSGGQIYTHRLGHRGHKVITDDAVAEEIAMNIGPGIRFVFFAWERRWTKEQTYGMPAVITAGRPEALPKEVNEKIDGVADELRRLAGALRRLRPDLKISVGNTGVNWVTPLLERGIKHGEHFDYFGTEEGLFMVPPERPTDATGNINWWARAICEYFGFYGVPLLHSESIYYPTGQAFSLNSERDQAGWYARSYLIGFAYDSVYAMSGAIVDSSGSYRYSGWGTAGYCNQAPECSPKLSYVAYATLTQLLDGASYGGKADSGATSLYALRFKQPDGTPLCAVWNLRGQREATLELKGAGEPELLDALNRPVEVHKTDGGISVMLTDLPLYVRGVEVTGVQPGTRAAETLPPQWRRIADLPGVADWTIDRQPDLGFGAAKSWRGVPRVLGRFALKAAPQIAPPGTKTSDAIRLIQGRHHASGLVPRYVQLRLPADRAIPIAPGTTRLGIWTYGNATWAHVKFLLRDAAGDEQLLLQNDRKGIMADNFEGWRFLSTPYLATLAPKIADGGWTFTGVTVTMPEQQVYVDDLVSTPRPWVALAGLYSSDEKGPPINYLPW